MRQCAPILIFAFNRPDHLRRTLHALASNQYASESDVTIICDGPRNAEERGRTDAVRAEAHNATGFQRVTVVERECNYGLAENIIDGITQALTLHDRVIVLEDDLVTSPYFLRYMNDGLELYADNPKVASIHGWVFPHDEPREGTFFLPGADCWGWGTWRRAWAVFNPDGWWLLKELRRRRLEYAFDVGGVYDYMGMLERAASGTVGSWAVRWLASAFLADMYTLYSHTALVSQIGGDGSGTNLDVDDIFEVPVAAEPVPVVLQPVTSGGAVYEEYRLFLARLTGTPVRGRLAWWYHTRGKPLLKSIIKQLLPPLALDAVRKLKHMKSPAMPACTDVWQEGFADWESACAAAGGHDAEGVFAKVYQASCAVRDGKAVYERDSVLFKAIEYSWPLLACLMWAAARHNGMIRIIDFGGALGSSYRQNRRFLDDIQDVSWNIVDQERFVRCGQQEFQTRELHFYDSIESCLQEEKVDGIILNGVLQYLEDPYAFIEDLCLRHLDYIILDRTPFSLSKEKITVQHVPENVYKASYPCRFLDKKKIETIIWQKYEIIEWFDAIGGVGWMGCLARRKRA